jgi:hypothetical protein
MEQLTPSPSRDEPVRAEMSHNEPGLEPPTDKSQ